MLLKELVDASAAMKATRSRLAKKAALVAVLRHVTADEAAIATSYLSGELRQRRTGLGWRSMATLPPTTHDASLTLAEVDDAFEAMAALSGPGSQGRRSLILDGLLRRATAGEQSYIAALVTGELRQGALDALVIDALAEAVGAPTDAVRRAVMLAGSTATVAGAVLRDGPPGLAAFTLSVGTPVRPMLASSASSVIEALTTLGGR
ncbi:MAG: ATP-dependent DNA ligase, partial [Arachnia sp.]